MTRPRVAAAAFAMVLLAACSPASGSPSPSEPAVSASASTTPASASPSAETGAVATPSPAPLKPPPAPKGVTIKQRGRDPGGVGYATKITVTITWKSPTTKGTEIRVFGVEACMPPAGQDPAPCLVKGTPLPASARDLITKGPASKGKVSWTWPAWENIGGNVAANGDTSYASIVVAAYNAAGHSKFVIVKTGEFCSACTY